LRASASLAKVKAKGDEAIGVDIVRRALESPIRQIAENAGIDGAIVAERVRSASGGEGYNALTGEYTDLVKAGVIDPTKVTRTALENAASIAGLLLTTEALISEIPEEKADAPAGGGHGGGGGMGGMY
jgi:chaperonin GroEL